MKDNSITLSLSALNATLTALVGEERKAIFHDVYRLVEAAENWAYTAGCQNGFEEGFKVGAEHALPSRDFSHVATLNDPPSDEDFYDLLDNLMEELASAEPAR